MNFMPVEISGRTAKLPICEVEISTETAKALESHSAKNLMVGIRPEHFEDSELVGDQPGPRFEVEVSILESMGSELYIYFDIEAGVPRRAARRARGRHRWGVRGRGRDRWSPASTPTSKAKRGEKLELWMDSSKLHFFDLDSGERITAGDSERGETDRGERAAGSSEVGSDGDDGGRDEDASGAGVS